MAQIWQEFRQGFREVVTVEKHRAVWAGVGTALVLDIIGTVVAAITIGVAYLADQFISNLLYNLIVLLILIPILLGIFVGSIASVDSERFRTWFWKQMARIWNQMMRIWKRVA